jgi:hypothetical protein
MKPYDKNEKALMESIETEDKDMQTDKKQKKKPILNDTQLNIV